MPKNVLGNDPFASEEKKPAGEQLPAKGEPEARADRSKTRSKSKQKAATAAASRPEQGKKKQQLKPAAKKARAKGAGRQIPRGGDSRPAADSSRARPADRPASSAPGQQAARSPLADGAAARLAAQAVSQRVQLPGAEGEAPLFPPGEKRHAPPAATGSLSEEIRRIEERLTHRPPSGIRQKAIGELSLLDRVGQLLQGDALRRLMMDWRLRYRSPEVDEFGLDPIYAESWRPLLEFLYHSYWRVEASGVEHLPDEGRAIIVANHAGTLPYDGLMLMSAVRQDHPAHREVRPLVEDFVFHFPYLGAALNRLGCVRACPENAERLLLQDRLVAVFPEGIKGSGKLYRSRYRLQRFGRGGFIKLALHTRAPIIPVAIIGAEEVHPMLAKVDWLARYLGFPYVPITPTFPWLGPLGAVPLPSKWQIRFGEPLDLASEFRAEASDNRILVHQLADKVRSTIQSMVDEALLSRQSIIFG